MAKRCVMLTLKTPFRVSMDGSGLSIARLADKTESEICKLTLSERTTVCIGDVFDVMVEPCIDRSLVLRGDLSAFDHLAANHDAGTIEIDGNAGDCLGGATDGCRVGMTGGRVLVRGNLGDRAGYRMRRGEIFVAGDAGDFLAAHMVAGTIGVAGHVGNHAGYAMRRGSILLASEPSLPSDRFSGPVPAAVGWLPLIGRLGAGKLDRMLQKMASGDSWSRRGDAAAGGLGEVVWPL